MLWLLPVRWLMKVGFMAAPGAMWCLSLESLGLQPSGTCWSSLLDSSWTAVLHAVLGRCATMALASHPTSTWPALFAGHLPQHLWGVQVQLGQESTAAQRLATYDSLMAAQPNDRFSTLWWWVHSRTLQNSSGGIVRFTDAFGSQLAWSSPAGLL